MSLHFFTGLLNQSSQAAGVGRFVDCSGIEPQVTSASRPPWAGPVKVQSQRFLDSAGVQQSHRSKQQDLFSRVGSTLRKWRESLSNSVSNSHWAMPLNLSLLGAQLMLPVLMTNDQPGLSEGLSAPFLLSAVVSGMSMHLGRLLEQLFAAQKIKNLEDFFASVLPPEDEKITKEQKAFVSAEILKYLPQIVDWQPSHEQVQRLEGFLSKKKDQKRLWQEWLSRQTVLDAGGFLTQVEVLAKLGEVDGFVLENLDRFFALNPNVEEIKNLESVQGLSIHTRAKILDQALSLGMVKDAVAFMFLMDHPFMDEKFRQLLNDILVNQKDLFWGLPGLTLEQVQYAIQNFTSEADSHVQLAEMAIAKGMVKSVRDFMSLVDPNGENPAQVYREAMVVLALSCLEFFMSLRPLQGQVVQLLNHLKGHTQLFAPFVDKILKILPTVPFSAFYETAKAQIDHMVALFSEIDSSVYESRVDQKLLDRLKTEGFDAVKTLAVFVRRYIPQSKDNDAHTYTIKDDQIEAHLQKLIEIGNRQGDLPAGWRGVAKKISQIRREVWETTGATLDSRGEVKSLLGKLREKVGAKPSVSEVALLQALKTYIASGFSAESGQAMLDLLYGRAAPEQELSMKVNIIKTTEHEGLDVLEGFYSHGGLFSRILAETFKKLDPDDLYQQGSRSGGRTGRNKDALLGSLKGVWASRKSDEEKRQNIARILQGVDSSELQSLSKRDDLDEALKQLIVELALGDVLSLAQLEENLFGASLQLLKTEKSKFRRRVLENRTIGFRPCKSITDGLFGLVSGVCTAQNLEAWKDPNYLFLAITDEDKKQIVGYIQLYKAKDGGKDQLIALGINPSHELLAEANPQVIYDLVIENLIAFAKEAGFQSLLIPVESGTHSNRAGIQKILEKLGSTGRQKKIYPLRMLRREIDWTHKGNYKMKEVWVVWEA